MTTSNGRGAKDDQCSCFDTAISAHMPTKQESKRQKRNSEQTAKIMSILKQLYFKKGIIK
jgi:hypothetical protein